MWYALKKRKGAVFTVDIKNIIAKNIVKLRKSVPMTQAELAEKIDYSEKAVSKWERGESMPDISVLKAIADNFGVTVDYLLQEEHPAANNNDVTSQTKNNRLVVTLMSATLVVLIATVVYVIFRIKTDIPRPWLAFVYAVPAVAVVLIVFNSVWGKPKHNFVYISILVWGILTCIYLTSFNWSYWLVFVVGVPCEIIIILWSRIVAVPRTRKRAKQKH